MKKEVNTPAAEWYVLVLMLWGLIYKGIYAQKMAYASFYAMFAIYKILT